MDALKLDVREVHEGRLEGHDRQLEGVGRRFLRIEGIQDRLLSASTSQGLTLEGVDKKLSSIINFFGIDSAPPVDPHATPRAR